MDETVQDIAAEDQLAHDPAADVGADALVSEDELAAALSEIESTAKAIAESQSDDDIAPAPETSDADGTSPERDAEEALTPSDAVSTAASEPDIDAEPEDEASVDVAPNAPHAGDISVSNALLDDDELSAALAEIEKTPHSERERIPSLDDGEAEPDDAPQIDPVDEQDGEEVAAEPVPEQPEDCGGDLPETTAQTSSEDSESPADAPAADAPAKPKVRFAIGKKSTEEGGDDTATPVDAVEKARAALTDPQTPPVVKKLVRSLDQGLEALNRPFARYGDSVRTLVGWCAVATIIASLLAMFTLPSLLPRRDAITYLKETRAKVASPTPSPVAAETEGDPG